MSALFATLSFVLSALTPTTTGATDEVTLPVWSDEDAHYREHFGMAHGLFPEKFVRYAETEWLKDLACESEECDCNPCTCRQVLEYEQE